MLSLGYPYGFPRKKFSLFGPAVWPAIADIICLIYMSEELYYIVEDLENESSFLKNKNKLLGVLFGLSIFLPETAEHFLAIFSIFFTVTNNHTSCLRIDDLYLMKEYIYHQLPTNSHTTSRGTD